MKKQQAYQFVHDAIDAIFVQADIELLDNFYHHEAMIHVGDDEHPFSAIQERMVFIDKTYEQRQVQLHDVAVIGNMIVFQVQQTALDKRTQANFDSTLTGVYKLKNNKVIETWLLTREPIDYLEA